jgi:hypothetical protein
MRALLISLCLATLATGARAQMQRDPAAAFAGADANKDGRISRAEFVAARQARFARFDRNGDGAISRDDFARLLRFRPEAGARIEAILGEADANHDGKVTRAEMAGAPTLVFDRADTNQDGIVDKAELAAVSAAPRPRG